MFLWLVLVLAFYSVSAESVLIDSEDFESYSSNINGYDKGFLTQGFDKWDCSIDGSDNCNKNLFDGRGSSDYGVFNDIDSNQYLKFDIDGATSSGAKQLEMQWNFTENDLSSYKNMTLKYRQRINYWNFTPMSTQSEYLYFRMEPVTDLNSGNNEYGVFNGGLFEASISSDIEHSAIRNDFESQASNNIEDQPNCEIYDGLWHDVTVQYENDGVSIFTTTERVFLDGELCYEDDNVLKPPYVGVGVLATKLNFRASANLNIDIDDIEIYADIAEPSGTFVTYNEVIFKDDFDNENLISEGWDVSSSCVENIGASGDSVFYSNDSSSCVISQGFDINGNLEQEFNFSFYVENYNEDSYFRLKESDDDYIEVGIISKPTMSNDDLALYLPFDSDVLDHSGSGYVLTESGDGYINESFGYKEGSYYFDGVNDHLNIDLTTATTDPLDIQEDISISVDIYWAGSLVNGMLFYKLGTPREYGFLISSTGAGVLYFGGGVYSTGYTFNDNEWYNLVITRDYSTGDLLMYVNGELEGAWVNTNLLPDNDNDLIIGEYTGSDFHGYLDEFKIFGRVLNVSEIENSNNNSILSLKGYGDCENLDYEYYKSFDYYDLDSLYSFQIKTDLEIGESVLFLDENMVFDYSDEDCFGLDSDKVIEIEVSENAVFEVDYFSLENLNIISQCLDGLDNDNDGYFDFDDEDCVDDYSFEDTVQKTECNDGKDNDNDGFVDYPDDFGCLSSLDNSEDPKQDTTCDLDECIESNKCIFLHDKACYEDITTHGFNVNPDWLTGFVYPEDYNSFDVFDLHEFLGYDVITDNGLESTEFMEIRKEFVNSADYPLINSRLEFFFEALNGAGDIEQERVDYILYSNAYNDQNKILHIAMFLSTYPEISNDIIVDMFEVSTVGNYSQIGTARVNKNYLFGRFQLNIEMNTDAQTYSVGWRDKNGAGAVNGLDYLIYTYDYPDRFSIKSYGDPSEYSSGYSAQVGMYLDEISINGKGVSEDTICNEWSSPYVLKEDFNGRITNCGWSANNDFYFDGELYITQDLDVYDLYKDFAPLYATSSRYYATDFIFTPSDFADNTGYVLVETFGTGEEKNFAIFFSKSINNSLEVGYYSDGDFNVVTTYPMSNKIRVTVVFDFQQNRWKLLINDNDLYEGLKIPNPLEDPLDVQRIKVFSYKSEYYLDSLSIFPSDSEGGLLGAGYSYNSEIVDPFPEWAGDTFCGYFQSKNIPVKYCSKDSDCDTKKCSPSGQCARFDFDYCDQNDKKRDDLCMMGAFVECGLENARDGIFGNFLLFLSFILIVIIFTYFVIMTRGKK